MAPRRLVVRHLHNILVLGRQPAFGDDPAFLALAPRDRGLAIALHSAVLRNLAGLDRLIDGAMRRPLPGDARARHVLRMALAGHYVLGTPPHAVVATALPLVEGGPRRLVHGVLSRLMKNGAPLPPTPLPGDHYARWQQDWGQAAARGGVRQFRALPPTDICLRAPEETDLWAERLGGTSLMPGHVRLPGSRHVTELPGFADGAWWVQDVAAQLPARLFANPAGAEVLDLCAAPGGKTMQLAAAGARVTALDISAGRMARLEENLRRTGLSAEIVVADALTHGFDRTFDAILLDAPCSATGTFRRHPDVLYLKDGSDIDGLIALQHGMLARAATLLRPGGQLVYAVCSLDRREAAPDLPGLLPDPIGAGEAPPWALCEGHRLSTPPSVLLNEGGADGFQIARFRRPA